MRVGLFRRRVGAAEAVLDPAVGYWQRPGEEQQVAHPLGDGDVCTAITLSEELLAALAGGVATVPAAPVLTGDVLDLAYRALTTRARRGAGALELGERVARLAVAALAQQLPERVASGRPATAAARRRLADATREVLTAVPEPLTLGDLARLVGASPYHLSRVFQAETGLSLTRFRNRLRLRRALERLAAGESSLASVAADLGFADHAHFCRTVRAQLGRTPAQLRGLLDAGEPSTTALRQGLRQEAITADGGVGTPEGESSVIITARACPAPVRPTGAGPQPSRPRVDTSKRSGAAAPGSRPRTPPATAC